MEAPYKRKKMESTESKIGPWLDTNRDHGSDTFFYFTEEQNDPDYVEKMRALLEISPSSESDSEESHTPKLKIESTCTKCTEPLVNTQEFVDFKAKVIINLGDPLFL